MVRQHCSNISVITVNFSGVRIFRIFAVMVVNYTEELLYPRHLCRAVCSFHLSVRLFVFSFMHPSRS